VVSGLATERFCVEGFIPRKGEERRLRLEEILADPRTTVVFEAPGRLAATLTDIAGADSGRRVVVCRELTKVHEEVWRSTAAAAATEFAGRAEVRGEVVIVVDGAPPAPAASETEVKGAVARRLAAGDTTRDAANAVATELGVSRHRAYDEAVRQRASASRSR
jgi:16S rRNA (cytidine1402-2'-O)-methyltransferase